MYRSENLDVSTGMVGVTGEERTFFTDYAFMFHLLEGLQSETGWYEMYIDWHLKHKDIQNHYTLGNGSVFGRQDVATTVCELCDVYAPDLVSVDICVKDYSAVSLRGLYFRLMKGRFHKEFLDQVKDYDNGRLFWERFVKTCETFNQPVENMDSAGMVNNMYGMLNSLFVIKKVLRVFPDVTKMQ